jgi:hypothetical protein
MKSSNRRLSLFIALLSAASGAVVNTAYATDQPGDAQAQARALLAPTRATHVTRWTPPAGANRAAPVPDVQGQARRSILGTPGVVTASTGGTHHEFGRAGASPPFTDAQVAAQQMILGVGVGQSSSADRGSAALVHRRLSRK